MNYSIDNIRASFAYISSYINKINETFLKENISGEVSHYTGTTIRRDPDYEWTHKSYTPKINMHTLNEVKECYAVDDLMIDTYLRDLLSRFVIEANHEKLDEKMDKERLSNYILQWKIEIPYAYDKKEHLKRLLVDSSNFFYKDNPHRSEILSLVAEIFPYETDLYIDEFQYNGLVCKIIDFQKQYVEIKSIVGVWGNFTNYKNSENVLPNARSIKIPYQVTTPDYNKYTVTAIGKGVFENLTKTETVTIPSQVKKCEWSFWNCKKLKSIKLDHGYFNEISSIDGVLFDKTNKLLIAYPNCHGSEYHVPVGTEKLGNCSFKDCDNLKRLYLPKTIKHIGLNAFYRCYGLEEIICDFEKDDVIFEGFQGAYGNVQPHWIYNAK